jgi:hypothetical protein
LTPKLPDELQNSKHSQRLGILQNILRRDYKTVRESSRKSRDRNKKIHDRKSKGRNFDVIDIVYLVCPEKNLGKCQKFMNFFQ